MRLIMLLLLLSVFADARSQEDYVTDPLPNGRLAYASMPDSVDICVGIYTLGRRIRVPKTIFLPTAWNDVTSKPSSLTGIAGLSPSNDDFLQRKSGAWANRTIAQVKTDLGVEATSVLAYQALGSPFKAETVNFPLQFCNTSSNLTDNQIRWVAVYLEQGQTITGIRVYSRVAGSYTGDQNNRVGLYTYSGGTLTLVASSTNSATLWTSGANAIQTIAFSSTYAASAGIHFVALVYNNSAQTTAPALASGTALNNAAMAAMAFTNSAKLYGTSTGNDIPSSIAMSSITAATAPTWVALY